MTWFGALSCVSMPARHEGHPPAARLESAPVPKGETRAESGALAARAKLPATCRVRRVGAGPLRRLTRDEYGHTVRDLLHVKRLETSALAADESLGPFRANLVAGTTELDAQQFMETAERTVAASAARLEALAACAPAERDTPLCAEKFVDAFGLRAFRRPLRPEERASALGLFVAEARSGGFDSGARAVAQSLLQSPYFLYHFEDPGDSVAPGLAALDPYALASRLSYFLWQTMPDEALFAAAAAGGLATAEGLRVQAERMLKDEKARRGVLSFHMQWLAVEDVFLVRKELEIFPDWYPYTKPSKFRLGAVVADREKHLGLALRKETERFVDHVVRAGDGRLSTLLQASFSFPDEPSARVYGLPQTQVLEPGTPAALDPKQRSGILTQLAFLATHAHADQTSPVARGVVVRKNLLCQDLPDPPPNVNNTPPEPDLTLTTRERFEEHRLSGVCSGCHKLIDPIGFAFEPYDGVGRFRATENGKPIDATGTLLNGGAPEGEFNGAVELTALLSNSRTVHQCYVRQWFRFALGRMETEADRCSLETLYDVFARSGRNIRELLVALPTTDSFRLVALDQGR